MTKNCLYIFFILLTAYACSDPASVDADREKKIIYDPNNSPALFEVEPNELDFGSLVKGNSKIIQFKIKNITDKQIKIDNLSLKNHSWLATFSNYNSPVYLSPMGSSSDFVTLEAELTADEVGYFSDTLIFQGHTNPKCVAKAEIPALYAEDVDFNTLNTSEFALRIFQFINLSSYDAVISEFELIDTNGVFFNEPKIQLPLTINPNSKSIDIKLTFNPNRKFEFNAEIKFKATFKDAVLPYKGTIKIKGKGI